MFDHPCLLSNHVCACISEFVYRHAAAPLCVCVSVHAIVHARVRVCVRMCVLMHAFVH